MTKQKRTRGGIASAAIIIIVLVCVLIGSNVLSPRANTPESEPSPPPETISETSPEIDETPITTPDDPIDTPPEAPLATPPEPTPEEPPEPTDEFFSIAMMGDCVLASDHGSKGGARAYERIVGDDYAYPFSMVKPILDDADFVIANLECVISDYNIPQQKTYRFRAPPEYVNILVEAGIDCVALGNNHTMDYGQTGYSDTQDILTEHGVGFAPNGGWRLFTTERGLKIGVYSKNLANDSDVKKAASEMKDAGAEVIIMALHWGDEGSYHPTSWQRQVGRAAIDAGAHIVMGTHPHTLQEMEEYKDGLIYYSLANWTFGGNTNPRDKDTVLAMVTIKRDVNGEISVFGPANMPCSVSGDMSINDYRPVAYEIDTPEYERVLSKLNGTFTGPNLASSYEPTTPETADDVEDGEQADDGEDLDELLDATEAPPDAPGGAGEPVDGAAEPIEQAAATEETGAAG
ncbi:MAG: CapA family protein, partial [Oscillospiraceae bacterium]|nr:CapA family protein [Oscillospiraceae bacterium]